MPRTVHHKGSFYGAVYPIHEEGYLLWLLQFESCPGCCTPSCAPGTLTHPHACLQRFLHAWGAGLSPKCRPTAHTHALRCPPLSPWYRLCSQVPLCPCHPLQPLLCARLSTALCPSTSDRTLMTARARSLSPGAGFKTPSSLGMLSFGQPPLEMAPSCIHLVLGHSWGPGFLWAVGAHCLVSNAHKT